VAASLVGHGVSGVVVQDGMATLDSLDRYRITAAMGSQGLGVVAGFGTNGPSHWAELAELVTRGLDTPGLAGVLVDWEGSWDHAQAQAQDCVNAILAVHPDAADRVIDTPWWAPLTLPDGSPTHPSAPNAQWGVLAKRRFVQTYPGDWRAKLAWARDPSQWPSLGTPAACVRPAVSLYARALNDVVASLISDAGPVACWDWTEADADGLRALRVVAALEALAYTGPSSVSLFQRAAGLTVDGVVGPRTLAALGVV
jgi:peptidoglycan hydrolase-like protein with peptidoglycan-binding domain